MAASRQTGTRLRLDEDAQDRAENDNPGSRRPLGSFSVHQRPTDQSDQFPGYCQTPGSRQNTSPWASCVINCGEAGAPVLESRNLCALDDFSSRKYENPFRQARIVRTFVWQASSPSPASQDLSGYCKHFFDSVGQGQAPSKFSLFQLWLYLLKARPRSAPRREAGDRVPR